MKSDVDSHLPRNSPARAVNRRWVFQKRWARRPALLEPDERILWDMPFGPMVRPRGSFGGMDEFFSLDDVAECRMIPPYRRG